MEGEKYGNGHAANGTGNGLVKAKREPKSWSAVLVKRQGSEQKTLHPLGLAVEAD